MFNIFSKKAWAKHEIDSSFAQFLQGVDMNPKVRAWLVGMEQAILDAALVGAIFVYDGGHFSAKASGLSFWLLLRRYMQQSPLTKDVEQIAAEKTVDAVDALIQKKLTPFDSPPPAK